MERCSKETNETTLTPPAAAADVEAGGEGEGKAGANAGVLYSHAQVPEYRDASELFVLTADSIFLVSSEDKAFAPAVREQIQAGADPEAALRESGVDGDDIKRIPLSSVRHLVSYGDENEIRIQWTNGAGSDKEANAWLTNRAAIAAAIAALKPALGGVTEKEEESSLLHVGTLPLVGIGAGVLLGLASILAAMLEGEGGRRNVLVKIIGLLNLLGTPLTLLLAALIIGGMGVWWFMLSKDRPVKRTLTPYGKPAAA